MRDHATLTTTSECWQGLPVALRDDRSDRLTVVAAPGTPDERELGRVAAIDDGWVVLPRGPLAYTAAGAARLLIQQTGRAAE